MDFAEKEMLTFFLAGLATTQSPGQFYMRNQPLDQAQKAQAAIDLIILVAQCRGIGVGA